ncbi:MAG TPA: trypsin-like peptidase domain-containing protein [Gemmatimonadales bacterium]|nr:trypsin-like peptidase domain-containing protein [Gemmatimonadales bacterium]
MTAAAPRSPAGGLAGLSNDLADAVEQAARSVVAVHARRRIPSSGVAWRPGVIVAASHALARDEDITVTLPDGHTVTATLAGRDETTDLAVLRVDAPSLPPAERADPTALRVGHFVLAVGRPGPNVTASMGVVSAVGGEWRTWQGGRIDRFVRLDLNIYDGFSGGALIEAGGRVLGINTSGLARATALTIPATTVDRVADQLLSHGRVQRGYLGLASQPVRLPEALRAALQLESGIGLVVVNVEPDGPADRAGVLLGDVIIAVDGTPVRDPADVLAALGPDRVGKPLTARVLRGGQPVAVTITVGRRPQAQPRRR